MSDSARSFCCSARASCSPAASPPLHRRRLPHLLLLRFPRHRVPVPQETIAFVSDRTGNPELW